MSSAARGAPGHATCPCCKVRLRPPDSRSFKTRHFPGKTTEVADVSVSRGTRPPATGRRAPTSRGVPPVAPRARTRRRARNRGDLRRRPPPRLPPAKSLTARPSIRNARIVLALVLPRNRVVVLLRKYVFPSLRTYRTRDKLHDATDTTRRTPTGRWCARRAPRPRSARGGGRSSGSAARTSARAQTWRAR